ncbi:unnamed protein product [Protopolystoma xenopodis]|uniref:Uncharacterized protein n=1 Tax=Protopolystoma xenopodis TaxID=117903 RepID=A0A448X837_9PLAT|nr:unnamed protein product [Protopolystoma xenopodis]
MDILVIWRKILLNDDVELLEALRDSMIWREGASESSLQSTLDASTQPARPASVIRHELGYEAGITKATCDFEAAQGVSQAQLAELFFDCYENGTGVYSYIQANYHSALKAADFRTLLRNLTGLRRFRGLALDGATILVPVHNTLVFLAVITGRFRVAEQLLRMRQFDIIPMCVLTSLILRRLYHEPGFPDQVSWNDILRHFSLQLSRVRPYYSSYFIILYLDGAGCRKYNGYLLGRPAKS